MRGRPKGSKGKTKIQQRTEQAVPLDLKEVKRQIRMLRKIKKNTHKGSDDRHDLCRKIRELQKQLIPACTEVTPEKQLLIDEIIAFNTKYRPYLLEIGLNFTDYSVETLRKHLEYLKYKKDIRQY
jgi:uncharacterized protein with von Willebrand factor type A (vWA) domain